METNIEAVLAVIEKRLDAMEEKIDAIADEVSEIKEDIPSDLDEELGEIKSLLIQMS